jgi:hypothetical protein
MVSGHTDLKDSKTTLIEKRIHLQGAVFPSFQTVDKPTLGTIQSIIKFLLSG